MKFNRIFGNYISVQKDTIKYYYINGKYFLETEPLVITLSKSINYL